MKKTLAIALILTMILGIASASPAELPEKIQMQMESGSGFKGEYTLNISKDNNQYSTSGNIECLSSQDNTIMQILDKSNNSYIFVKNKNHNEISIGDTYYSLKNFDKFINTSITRFASKILYMPSTFGMILDILNYKHDYNLDTALLEKKQRDEAKIALAEGFERLKPKIDIWLEKYMNKDMNSIKLDKVSSLSLEYTVPYDAFKDLLKSLVRELKHDTFLLEALKQSMPHQYTSTFLELSDINYIDFAIDNISIDENILLGKTFTTKGELVASYISLPLVDKDLGKYRVKYNEDNSNSKALKSIEITSEYSTINIDYTKKSDKDTNNYKGTFNCTNSDTGHKGLSINFDINTINKAYVDNNGKNHMDTTITMSISQGEKSEENIDSYKITYDKKLSSNVPKSSSTKIVEKLYIENSSKKESIDFCLDAKTTAPFKLSQKPSNNLVVLDLISQNDAINMLNTVKSELSKFIKDIDKFELYHILQKFFSGSNNYTNTKIDFEN